MEVCDKYTPNVQIKTEDWVVINLTQLHMNSQESVVTVDRWRQISPSTVVAYSVAWLPFQR